MMNSIEWCLMTLREIIHFRCRLLSYSIKQNHSSSHAFDVHYRVDMETKKLNRTVVLLLESSVYVSLKSIMKQAKDGMFKAIGSPWSVPWTAETVLQVISTHLSQ